MEDRFLSRLPMRKLWAIAALSAVAIATTPTFGDSIKSHPEQRKGEIAIGSIEPNDAAGFRGFSPDTVFKLTETASVKFGVKTYLSAWVLYNTKTCQDLSTGTWVGVAAPKYGVASQGTIKGHLANNVCPGHTFTFRSLYYKWDVKTKSKTDQFKADWVGNKTNGVIGTFKLNLK